MGGRLIVLWCVDHKSYWLLYD